MGSETQVNDTDWRRRAGSNAEEHTMKIWNKPQVREQEVGLEVTSYLPAEIDII